MARFKYLSASLLALFLSLASCSNNPASPSDPGGTTPGGDPGETTQKALFTFSELFADLEEFTSSKKVGEFTLSASVGSGKNTPKYYTNGTNLRFYHGNSFTISGAKMTEINFDASYNNSGTVTPSVGTYDHETKVWTGDATSVTFTIGTSGDATNGQYRIVAIGVNQDASGEESGGGGGGEPPAPTGEHATFDLSQLYSYMGENESDEFTSLTGYGLSLSAVTGSGSNAPTMFQNGYSLRLYLGNKLTIAGSNITRVDFTFDTTKPGTFSANSGTMGDTTWTGSTNSLVLTVASGQRRIKTMTVYADIDETDIPEIGGDVPGGGGEESTYTALSVFKDLVLSLTGNSMSNTDAAQYWDEDYLEYGIGFDWDTTSETTLEAAVKEAIDYLPEYLVIIEEAASGTWEDDGSDGWFATLSTDDYSVTVSLGSYIDEGYVVLNIEVFEE